MFFLLLFAACATLFSPIYTVTPDASPYAAEMTAYCTKMNSAKETEQSLTAQEKLFHDIFSFATLPYTQPIKKIAPEDFPLVSTLVNNLSSQYEINEPLLFLACDASTPHIDIKICMLNKESAILIHPNTILMLSSRVLDRYVEQAIMRIKNTIDHYKESLIKRAKKAIGFGVGGAGLLGIGTALLYLLAEKQRPAVIAASCLTSACYGAALCYYLTRKHVAFSFQRISSFHNNEQAREDSFPPLTINQKPIITENPGILFSLDSIIKTQEYLKARNKTFAEFEQFEAEKKESLPLESDSELDQTSELLRSALDPEYLRSLTAKRKSTK